ncbi:hypothetical protein [Halovenus amylolytica]|uniref:hypothetical protein n=1 Tax=Halovenus amylolytica TaxID=2500550 RepID=UPI002FC42E69
MIRNLLGFLWSLLMLPIKLILLPFKLLSLLVSIVIYSLILLLLGGIVFLFVL